MSKLNINKKEWLELVFEGRNKSYGAYQLRQEEGKTTITAFFSALVLFAGIAILSSFTDKPKVEDPIICILPPSTLVKFQPKTEQPKEAHKATPKSTAPKTPKFTTPVVVKKEDAPKTEVPTNANQPKTSPTTTTETPGTGPEVVGPGPVEVPVPDVIDKPLPSSMLEQNPAFPGGIGEFLKIVGKRFVAPEIDEEKTLKVIVYFVVEKDGTLSNITVPRSPGYSLDKEAIRVLKSIKTKWEPGIYKGKPVRTSYSLPIVINMQ
ncbi:MAG: energy transducer TonB [Flavobacterium sp.]